MDGSSFIQSNRLPLVSKFDIQQQDNEGGQLKQLSLAQLTAKLNAVKQLRQMIRAERSQHGQQFLTGPHVPQKPSLKVPVRATVLPPSQDWWEDEHIAVKSHKKTRAEPKAKHNNQLRRRKEKLDSLCAEASRRAEVSARCSNRLLNTPNSYQCSQAEENRAGNIKSNGEWDGSQVLVESTECTDLDSITYTDDTLFCNCEQPDIPQLQSCRFCYCTFRHSYRCSSNSSLVWPRCVQCAKICNGFPLPSVELGHLPSITAGDRLLPADTDWKYQPSEPQTSLVMKHGQSTSERSQEMSVRLPPQARMKQGRLKMAESRSSKYNKRKRDRSSSHDNCGSPCSFTQPEIDDRSFLEVHGNRNLDQLREEKQVQRQGIPPSALQARDLANKKLPIDWTNIHRQAYIQALAVNKAGDLMKARKKGRRLSSLFGNMTTPSYSYSYFSKAEKGRGMKGLQMILGRTNLYSYYPTAELQG